MALVPTMYTDYESYFRDAICFLREYSWIYNFAATELLVNSVLEKIPHDWASTLLALPNEELNGFPQGLIKDDWPDSLINFCHWCRKLKIPHDTCIEHNVEIPDKIRRGLTPKKQHEVASLAQLVHKECSPLGIAQVLDMGSGLGYLDQLLNHQHGYSVIGLETKADLVKTATERQLNLNPTSSVKHIICNISPDSKHIIESKLSDSRSDTCMVGLHTCGDLTVNAINLFMQLEATKLMILVPCCYHKMALVGKNEFVNFPLSFLLRKLLSDCREFVTRPFLRLASQETANRWQHMGEDIHKCHSENTMARAVLQLAAHEGALTLKKRNRRAVRRTKRTDFESFMDDALSRFEFETEDVSLLRVQMTELWNKHRRLCPLVEVFTALQMAVQNVAESFLHADRAAYLQEHGVTSIKIVKVMDDILSPRCCALIAKK